MICSKGHYVSGDSCKICEEVLREKPTKPKTIRKKSLKTIAQDAIYMVLRNKFLEDNPCCAVYPSMKSTEVHHKKGRLGKNYTDVSTFLAVSREGHNKIELNPEWAIQMGYSESRLKTT